MHASNRFLSGSFGVAVDRAKGLRIHRILSFAGTTSNAHSKGIIFLTHSSEINTFLVVLCYRGKSIVHSSDWWNLW